MKKYYSEFGETPNICEGMDNAELTSTNIAWLAGVYDGEGSLSFFRFRNRNCVVVNITNTDLTLLEKARKIMSSITGREFKIYKKNWNKTKIFKSNKQVYSIECNNYLHTYKLLKALLPHLTSKKQKAENAILYLQIRSRELVKSSNKPASQETNLFFERIMGRGVTTERVAPEMGEATV